MKIESLYDLKKYFNEHPIPKDINVASIREQNKIVEELGKVYYQTVIKWLIPNYNLDGIIVNNVNDAFIKHINNMGADVKRMLLDKIAEINYNYLSKTLDRLYDSIVDNSKIDYSLLRNVGIILYNGQIEVAEDLEVKYNELFDELLKRDASYLIYYRGNDIYYYEKALESKQVSVLSIINVSSGLSNEKKIELYRELIKKNYDDVSESEFLEETNYTEGDNCYSFIRETLTTEDYKNENFIKLLKNRSPEYVSNALIELREEKPLRITIDILNYLYDCNLVDEQDYADTFGFLLGNDINTLKQYKGKNISADLINLLTTCDTFNKKTVIQLYHIRNNASFVLYNSIFKIVVSNNPQLIDHYTCERFDVCRVALEHDAKIDATILINDFLVKPSYFLTDDDIKFVFDYLGVKPIDINALRAYGAKNNAAELVLSFDKVNYVLEVLHIDRDIFIQCSFASKNAWLTDILTIFDQNKIIEFSKVYNKFIECYYKLNEKSPNILIINALLDTLKNYNRYRELCENIVNDDLDEEDISRMKTLFNDPNIVKKENDEPITNKDELFELDNILLEKYRSKVASLSTDSYDEAFKEVFCEIMLNMSPSDVDGKITRYGSIKDLKQMLFDNRGNEELFGDILEMMAYVAFMEEVYNCEEPNEILRILNTILKYPNIYRECVRCKNLFATFDDKMNKLYAKELRANMTDLNNLPNELIDKDFTRRYGIETIDLSNSKYLLAYHTVSNKEKIEDLVNGIASGANPVISLTLSGSRNQNVYGLNRMIVATDIVPEELFILTSTSNACSNGCVKRYGCDIDTSRLKMKSSGAYETSASFNYSNPETLVCREGLKFKYIVLPDGRAPTKNELEYAHKYGMKFVITQDLKTMVKNPKPIPKFAKVKSKEPIVSHKEELSKMRELLLKNKEKKPRKIAIFADPHGLYEPTLAILEDIRMQGITEIYSLGDNIGTGPNPKEVMDLLEEYNVKSIRGDQELCVLGLTDTLKKYLEGNEKIIKNSLWTRRQLTEEQIERIKSFPERMIIKIGGKKIMLSHYMRDYNTDELLDIPKGVTRVFQGHSRYTEYRDQIKSIPRASNGKANYIIVEEKPNGGYYITSWVVSFNPKQVQYDIIESDLPMDDKDKISHWVSGR